jgi:hypothetical protein
MARRKNDEDRPCRYGGDGQWGARSDRKLATRFTHAGPKQLMCVRSCLRHSDVFDLAHLEIHKSVTDGARTSTLRSHNPPTWVATRCRALRNRLTYADCLAHGCQPFQRVVRWVVSAVVSIAIANHCLGSPCRTEYLLRRGGVRQCWPRPSPRRRMNRIRREVPSSRSSLEEASDRRT